MKKFLSISLLLVFLFNLGGYYAIYWCLQYHAKMEMDHRLDSANYAEEDIVTTKIPLNIPYYFDQSDYERIEGSYEQNGEFFKLVKQRFEKDTLYIVSIKDHKEKVLFNTLVDFVKLSNDSSASSHQAMKLFGSLIKDYTPLIQSELSEHQNGWMVLSFRIRLFNLITRHCPVFSPPPDAIL